MPLKPPSLSIADVADLALQHLAQNPEQLAEFMVQSGLGPAGLRDSIGTPVFARGLVDYVVGNEPLLLAVAAEHRVRPEAIVEAWARQRRREH